MSPLLLLKYYVHAAVYAKADVAAKEITGKTLQLQLASPWLQLFAFRTSSSQHRFNKVLETVLRDQCL